MPADEHGKIQIFVTSITSNLDLVENLEMKPVFQSPVVRNKHNLWWLLVMKTHIMQ